MNTFAQQQAGILHETTALRTQILDAITDADLSYRLPGDNDSLGEVLVNLGETEQLYTDSFRTFKMAWKYGFADPAHGRSVAALRAWFETLDRALMDTFGALSDEQVNSGMIDRGGYQMPATIHWHVYREALLIAATKCTLYLRALRKPLSEQLRTWIG